MEDIKTTTAEEKQAAMDNILAMEKKAHALSDEERMHICDMGFYNSVIQGYLIEAMNNADFSRAEIERALDGLKWAFDDTTAAEAAEVYRKF